MYIMGIETSCDDTSVSVIDDNNRIISNIISSQIDVHKKYGGVVPELASRRHIENISTVITEALEKADIRLSDIGLFAVTKGPGLIGALLVGLSAAKAIAYALNKPLIGVNHIEGHILSAFFLKNHPPFPFVSIIVSGGHTELYLVKGFCRYSLLGETMDDAVGECFDKTAKMLGLSYPGGPEIELAARSGDPNSVAFPRPCLKKDNLDFSFSGLKTSVRNYINSNKDINKADVAASFQSAAVDVIVEKLFKAAEKYHVNTVSAGGGVISNSRLKEKIRERAKTANIAVYFPPPVLSTDNAAMIALAGYLRYTYSNFTSDDPFSLDADPRMKLQDKT